MNLYEFKRMFFHPDTSDLSDQCTSVISIGYCDSPSLLCQSVFCLPVFQIRGG